MRISLSDNGLTSSEHASSETLHQALKGVLRTLPPRERSILRLLYYRGASQRELAGALGISRAALRHILKRAIQRATDPMQLALVRNWRRLTPQEQRLAYAHRILGLSLREIARRRLIEAPDPAGGCPTASTLRRHLRKIERKLQRAEAARGPEGQPPGGHDRDPTVAAQRGADPESAG